MGSVNYVVKERKTRPSRQYSAIICGFIETAGHEGRHYRLFFLSIGICEGDSSEAGNEEEGGCTSGAGEKTRAGEPVMHAYIYRTSSVTYIPPGLSQNFAQRLSLLYGPPRGWSRN
jgi:hypothetical protein